ncbi:MAG: hypothetical protein CMO74_03515 [Verrucomicrobiales bacterium]|nr:hypothetical protein [Verrucomicrobiales bacterium]|tara:strand:- start:690 stop:1019 length:330 start_codon:yes stop_codon:yes gene_type:complete
MRPPQPVNAREAEIAQIFRDMGGVVRVDTQGKVNEVILARTAVRDDDLLLLKELSNLRILSLAHTRITPAGLEHLKQLRQLKTLLLYKTATFAAVDSLREAMPWCIITD